MLKIKLLSATVFLLILFGCNGNETKTEILHAETVEIGEELTKEIFYDVVGTFISSDRDSVQININNQLTSLRLDELGNMDLSLYKKNEKVIFDYYIKTNEATNGVVKSTFITSLKHE